jgi:hypothetical protein
MADDTRPLRALGPDDPQPRVADLFERRVGDLTPQEMLEVMARRFGGGARAGEVTLELVFRSGRFVRSHRHETNTAPQFDDLGDSAA